MNAVIEVPAAGAYFEGHFPGRPILPGVAELTLALDALEREARRPIPIQGIAFARLRQLVLPGDRLELAVREQDAARLRVDVKRAGVLVANAEFILGTPEMSRDGCTASLASTQQGDIIPRLDELLPHRPPMRFLTSILQASAQGLVCAARIPGECALASKIPLISAPINRKMVGMTSAKRWLRKISTHKPPPASVSANHSSQTR